MPIANPFRRRTLSTVRGPCRRSVTSLCTVAWLGLTVPTAAAAPYPGADQFRSSSPEAVPSEPRATDSPSDSVQATDAVDAEPNGEARAKDDPEPTGEAAPDDGLASEDPSKTEPKELEPDEMSGTPGAGNAGDASETEVSLGAAVVGPADATAAQPADSPAATTGDAPKPEPTAAVATEPVEPTPEDEARFQALWAKLRPKVRVATRLNTTVQGDRRSRLDGYRFDTIFILPRLTGRITDLIGWQLAFFGRATDFSTAEVRLLDVIAELNVRPELNVWAGRFVVPADRSNLSGPFFVPVWNYPGFYANQYTIGPVAGAVGRDVGSVVWGDVGEGRFKYYAAVQTLEDRSTPPRMTGRMNVTLYGKEPGFYNAGGYLGKRDVVALGGSLQYQPSGERIPAIPDDPESVEIVQGDLWVADVDMIAEKNFGRGGTPTLEATYYAFDKFRPYRHAYFVSAAYLYPWKLGPGQIQSGIRWQQAFPGATTGSGLAGLDVSTAYLFAGYRARFVVVYQHQRLGDGGPQWNAFNIGFQFIIT